MGGASRLLNKSTLYVEFEIFIIMLLTKLLSTLTIDYFRTHWVCTADRATTILYSHGYAIINGLRA